MKKYIFLMCSLLMLSARLPAQNGAVGNLTASSTDCTTTNACLEVDIPPGMGSATVKLSGTMNVVVQFEASADPLTVTIANAKWVAFSMNPSDGTASATSATESGSNLSVAWQQNIGAYKRIRIRTSTYTSGTAAGAINLSTASARSGGGGGGSGLMPNGPGAFLVSTKCNGTTSTSTPPCYQVHADLQAVSDATFTASANTVATGTNDPPFCNGTTLPCTAAQIAQGHTTDVGTIYVGLDNCLAINEMECSYNCPQGTIATVVDAHDVTLSGTCTRNSSATANSNNFYWTQDDSTQLTAAWTAAQTYAQFTGPATIQLPCGKMGMGTQSFVFVPIGVRHYTTGMNGCGDGNPTEIIPLPKMNCTGNFGGALGCLLLSNYSQDTLGNFSLNASFRNFLFNGYGLPDKDPSATVTSLESGIYAGFGTNLYNVSVQGWMMKRALATVLYGINCSGCNSFGSSSYAAGNISLLLEGFATSQSPAAIFGGDFGGSVGPSIDIGTGMTSTHGVYVNQNENGCFTTSPCYGVRNITSGSNYTDYGSQISTGVWVGTGAKTTLEGSFLTGNGATYSFYIDTGTGVLALQNVNITNHAHIVGGTLLDQCGNTPAATFGGYDLTTGSILACPNGANGISPVPVITGTGACGTIGSQLPATTGGYSGSFACTGTTGASTMTLTFNFTSLNGWACNASDQTTVADKANQTSTTTKTCVLTTAATAANDVISWSANPN